MSTRSGERGLTWEGGGKEGRVEVIDRERKEEEEGKEEAVEGSESYRNK